MDAHLRKRRINARKISQHILSQEEPHSRMPISPSGSFRMGINMSYPYLPYYGKVQFFFIHFIIYCREKDDRRSFVCQYKTYTYD